MSFVTTSARAPKLATKIAMWADEHIGRIKREEKGQ